MLISACQQYFMDEGTEVTQNLFAFTAADPAAQANLDVSITRPIPASLIQQHVNADDAAALQALEATHGGLYAWGAVPGSMNDKYYKTLQVGDYVICIFGGHCRFVATVTFKLDNDSLARAMWGEAQPGTTWRYMFFMTRPIPIDVPLSQLNGFLPPQFFGFARVGNSKMQHIGDTYGTLSAFIDDKLLSSLATKPSVAPYKANVTATGTPMPLCLLGTEKSTAAIDDLARRLQEHDAVAVWWSFKLQADAIRQLPEPFHVYLNAGSGRITHRLVCTGVAVADGPTGIQTPWPHYTSPAERDRTNLGPRKNEIFKTWLLIEGIEQITPAASIGDFEPAAPWSHPTNLLNPNAFGYAYLKHPVSVKPELDPATQTKTALSAQEACVPYGVDEAVNDLFMNVADFEKALRLLAHKKNLILQGSPGVGKTFIARRLAYSLIGSKVGTNIETVQFHQAYSYEDFIQGFRPKHDGSGFVIRNGVFHRFCELARAHPEQKYVFIIDEINRGNLSKIFGELLMLVEPDKRCADWGVRLAYADEKAPPFHVPANVHLLGMMNTADRSLTSIDYALRRRFAFIHVKPGFAHPKFMTWMEQQGWTSDYISHIREKFIALNTIIAEDDELREGFCVGHSYFCAARPPGMSDKEYYCDIIETEIRPLLEDYWFDKKPEDIDAIIDDLM